jgi:2-polyprenyl-3-methyl-5-hydroxy-6-metoxy-1,4-benzoquinol methylase
MNSASRVQRHFDADSVRFDAIYEETKPPLQRFVDRKIRGVVTERLRITRVLAPQPGPWSVLDVGCGSGRFDVALAKDGATRALGIDFAPKMIELARADAERSGVADRCAFEVANFLEFDARDEKFDVVLAMGYFDYVEDARPHLEKMVRLCKGRVFASFPKRWEWRVPIRRVRFALHGGFVRFYSRGEVDALTRATGLAEGRAAVLDLGRDYLLVLRP